MTRAYMMMSDAQLTTSATGVKEVDAIGSPLFEAQQISAALTSSNAQVEDKRRAFAAAETLGSDRANSFASFLVAKFGWTQEAAAFSQVGAAGKAAALAAGAHKSDASWAALYAAAKNAFALFQAAAAATFARARAEAAAAEDAVRAAIGSLSARSPMEAADWTAVDGIVARLGAVRELVASLPLEAKDAVAADGAPRRLAALLEAKVAALSSAFSNKAENLLVTRAGVLGPQGGRKLANWADRNKLWLGLGLGGVVAGVTFLKKK